MASSFKLNCGISEIAFSGHVATQIPHCKHASSLNNNCGESGLSWRAPAGHAFTHDKHIVQLSRSTSTLPYGAPLGNSMIDFLLLLDLERPCIPALKIPLGAPSAKKGDDFILLYPSFS